MTTRKSRTNLMSGQTRQYRVSERLQVVRRMVRGCTSNCGEFKKIKKSLGVGTLAEICTSMAETHAPRQEKLHLDGKKIRTSATKSFAPLRQNDSHLDGKKFRTSTARSFAPLWHNDTHLGGKMIRTSVAQ